MGDLRSSARMLNRWREHSAGTWGIAVNACKSTLGSRATGTNHRERMANSPSTEMRNLWVASSSSDPIRVDQVLFPRLALSIDSNHVEVKGLSERDLG
jgi:hypothetical protein